MRTTRKMMDKDKKDDPKRKQRKHLTTRNQQKNSLTLSPPST